MGRNRRSAPGSLSRGRHESSEHWPGDSGALRRPANVHRYSHGIAAAILRRRSEAHPRGRHYFPRATAREANCGLLMLPNPLALIAEITHRCPLHCVYCSNPLELAAANSELKTEDWLRVFTEAAQMGVLHLHLTGGEPLARTDLEQLTAAAHQCGLYTNLITSGVGSSRDRLKRLVDAGLDHIQL